MRSTLLLLLLACACSKSAPTASTQAGSDAFTSIDLKAKNQGGMLTFDTGHARGIVTIEPGVVTGYELVTQTTAGESSMKTTIKVDGRDLSIEGDSIRIGEKKIGPLSGEVKIEVKKDGVYVDGAKKSDF